MRDSADRPRIKRGRLSIGRLNPLFVKSTKAAGTAQAKNVMSPTRVMTVTAVAFWGLRPKRFKRKAIPNEFPPPAGVIVELKTPKTCVCTACHKLRRLPTLEASAMVLRPAVIHQEIIKLMIPGIRRMSKSATEFRISVRERLGSTIHRLRIPRTRDMDIACHRRSTSYRTNGRPCPTTLMSTLRLTA